MLAILHLHRIVRATLVDRSEQLVLLLAQGLYARTRDVQAAQHGAMRVLLELLFVLYAEGRVVSGHTARTSKGDPGEESQSLLGLASAIVSCSTAAAKVAYAQRIDDIIARRAGSFFSEEAHGGAVGDRSTCLRHADLRAVFVLLTQFECDGAPPCFLDHGRLDVECIGDMYQRLLGLALRADTHGDLQIVLNKRKTESASHHLGATYTPPEVIDYLLGDALRRTPKTFPRMFDPACGTGHFLVAALRALRVRIPRAATQAGSECEHAAVIAQRCIFGADLDPMAASLARMVVALEVMGSRSVSEDLRRNIQTQDSLQIPPKERASYDVICGNPPYIRASRSGISDRERIESSGTFKCLRGKWDTWMPFVEMAWQMAEESGGIAALVVSHALSYAPYAQDLRAALHACGHLAWVSHFDATFTRWSVKACCLLLDAHAPQRTERRSHPQADALTWREELDVANACLRPEQARMRARRDAYRGLTVGDVAYVSKGIELHSHQAYKADGIIFKKTDLLRERPDALHPVSFLESKQIGRGRRVRRREMFLEYGADKKFRAPRFVNRPTFPSLHAGPRLLLSKSIKAPGAMRTDETCVVCQNTLVVKRWCALSGFEPGMRRKTARIRRLLGHDAEAPRMALQRTLSSLCSDDVLLGIFLSATFTDWIKQDRRAMYNMTPEVVEEMPLPVLPIATGSGTAPLHADALTATNLRTRVAVLRTLAPEAAYPETYALIEGLVRHLSQGEFAQLDALQPWLDALVALLYRPWTEGSDSPAWALERIVQEVGAQVLAIDDAIG